MGSVQSSTPNALGLNPEPIEGDSLTRFLRSVTNTGADQGQQTFKSGQQTFGQGIKDFGPALQYWQDILSGNRSSMESAIAPEKQSILDQYRAKRKQLATTGARSGGTNEVVAQSEFSQAGDVAGLLQHLRPQAAKGVQDIASQIAGLGLGESNLGIEQFLGALNGLLGRRGQNVQQDAGIMQMIGSIAEAVGGVAGAAAGKP